MERDITGLVVFGMGFPGIDGKCLNFKLLYFSYFFF